MRKKLAAIAIVAGVGLAASAAFAYWTAQGTGSGTAGVGTDSGVSITGVNFDGPDAGSGNDTLYPGHSVPVHFTVNNLSANSDVVVEDVVADEGALDDNGTPLDSSDDFFPWPNGISGLPSGCSNLDFHFAAVTLDERIAESASTTGAGTLQMDDTDSNQDACKLATPTLHLKVDNSGTDPIVP